MKVNSWGKAMLGLVLMGAVACAQEPAPEPAREPDYAEVAADARKIAAEIEERLIEAHMADAKRFLNAADAAQGHAKADEAYREMEEMISFCESTGGKAGEACQFKLQIKMSLNPGNTLAQLSDSMKPGSSGFGGQGQGSAGQSSSARFGMYGPKPFGQPAKSSSRLGDDKAKSQSAPNGERDPFSGSVEELNNARRDDRNFAVEGEGRVLEEYRTLIDAYFKRVAEEDRKP